MAWRLEENPLSRMPDFGPNKVAIKPPINMFFQWIRYSVWLVDIPKHQERELMLHPQPTNPLTQIWLARHRPNECPACPQPRTPPSSPGTQPAAVATCYASTSSLHRRGLPQSFTVWGGVSRLDQRGGAEFAMCIRNVWDSGEIRNLGRWFKKMRANQYLILPSRPIAHISKHASKTTRAVLDDAKHDHNAALKKNGGLAHHNNARQNSKTTKKQHTPPHRQARAKQPARL